MICQIVKACASEVFKWISQQDEIGEESITDWMLYKINDLSPQIIYKQFNRFDEARITGADFEFWILTNTQNFKGRVQAKRLRPNKDLYSSIAYANDYGLQIEKLIRDSNRNGFKALYAFYNNENHNSLCQNNIQNEGVYFSDAKTLHRKIILAPRTQISSSELIAESTPFSCWFCCPLSHSRGRNSLSDFIERYFTDTEQTSEQNITGLTNEIPNYVEEAVNYVNRQKGNGIIDFDFEREYRLSGINGLLIIDNRKK
tara:strand:- start:59 stop:832 length:774 start_codon:yes stop_codon:yes gene_type:complete